MPKTLMDNKNVSRSQQATLTTPSRIDEGEPKVARTVGLVGACFLLFGIGMHIVNAYTDPPRFSLTILGIPLVTLWLILGVMGLVYHAARDRTVTARRGYGVLGCGLLLLGAVWTTLVITTTWVSPAYSMENAKIIGVAAAGIVGLLMLAFMVAPFVRDEVSPGLRPGSEGSESPNSTDEIAGQDPGQRPGLMGFFPAWLQGLQTSRLVQQVTILGAIAVAALVGAGYALLRFDLLPYSLGGLVLGLVYLMLYASNEEAPTWRDAGVYAVGAVGTVAGLIGLSSVGTDWLGFEEILMPHGLIFGLIGLVFLWSFIVLAGADTNLGYRTAWAVGIAGAIVFVLAAGRSLYPTFAQWWREDYSVPSYLVPTGFLLMFLGALYAIIGETLIAENRTVVMMRRELAAFFYSPIAYVVLAGVALVAWIGFILWIAILQIAATRGVPMAEPIVFNYLLHWFPFLTLLFTVPMMTMRLLSEETRTGTMEVLMTAPVGEASVVLSKFLATWLFFMLAWGTWLIYPILLRYVGEEPFDYRPILSFYLILGCMAANFLGMGLFFSSLSRNQIIAFLLAFAGMLGWFGASMAVWQLESTVTANTLEVLKYVSFLTHLEEFLQGRVHLKYMLFHLSMSVFWLFLSVKVLESRKWK